MMGCGCNRNRNQMLSGLMSGLLVEGSEIQVGVSYNTERGTYEDSNPDWVRQVIVGSMLGSGAFSEASAVRSYSALSTYLPQYLTIYGKVAHDFANDQDVGGFIRELFTEYLPDVNVYRVDAVLIRSVPAGQAGNPNVAQPNTPADWQRPSGPAFTPTPTRPSPNCPEGFYDAGWFGVNCKPITPGTPGRCDFDSMEWDEYLGCVLDVSPSQAVVAAAVAAVVVAVLLRR
jgi:hypothetical protein